jgi:hypothetical protein
MADLRPHLEDALRADLVGPYSLEPTSTEVLEHATLRWYTTGFLTPEGSKPADASTEEADDTEADDADDDATTTDGAPKIPRRLPASIGLTVHERVDSRAHLRDPSRPRDTNGRAAPFDRHPW